MIKILKRHSLLIAILILAAVLRLWAIDFGLPQVQIGDEGALVGAAMFAGTHGLRSFRYIYGSLVPYILLIEYGTYFMIGLLQGRFTSMQDLYLSIVKDPRDVILMGRVTMAIIGVVIVWLTYYVGKQFYSKRIGVLASLFTAIAFLCVKESHYLKEGNPAAFFTLACYYFTLKILNNGKTKDYIFAGLMLGLGVGAKFEPLLMTPIVFLSHFVNRGKIIFGNLKYFCLGFISMILLTFPYVVIDIKTYVQILLKEIHAAKIIYPQHLQNKPVWWWFLTIHIPQGLDIPLFIAAIIGFIIAIIRSRSNRNYFLISLLPIIFLATIDYWQKFHAARYALLTVPFYAFGAAVFVDSITGFIKKTQLRFAVLVSCIIGLSFVSVVRSIKFNTMMTKLDTRFISRNWIEKNIPAGSRVLVETMTRSEYPANINVALILNSTSIDRYIQQANASGYPGTYLKALKTVTSGSVGYDLIATGRVDVAKDVESNESTTLTTADYWTKQKVAYLVLSSWATKPDMTSEFKKSIINHYVLIKEFQPNPEFSQDPHFVQMDYQALDSINVLNPDLIFGPKIEVYQIRGS